MTKEHNLVKGSTGSGQSTKPKYPKYRWMLSEIEKAISNKDNVILTDTSGKLSNKARRLLENNKYTLYEFNFVKKSSCHYNPLLLNTKEGNIHLAKMMSSLCGINSLDPFWRRQKEIDLEALMHYVQTKYADNHQKCTFVTVKEIIRKTLGGDDSEYPIENTLLRTINPKQKFGYLTELVETMERFDVDPLHDLLSDNNSVFDEILKSELNVSEYEPKYAIIIKFSLDNEVERILCNSLVCTLFTMLRHDYQQQARIRKRTTHFVIEDATSIGDIPKALRFTLEQGEFLDDH